MRPSCRSPSRDTTDQACTSTCPCFENDTNVFYDPNEEHGLSKRGRGFIAGLLHHGREITAITNQWVNSYKRLVTGFDAPVYETWGRNDQSAVVRVPVTKVEKASSTRVEYRAPDPACNPYLTFSVILAAGLAGIENNYELPAQGGSAAGAHRLPSTLAEALDAMEKSSLVRDALGEHVFEWFLRNKRQEWEGYEQHVSRYELDRYLPML